MESNWRNFMENKKVWEIKLERLKNNRKSIRMNRRRNNGMKRYLQVEDF
jgi:hypothetical protein